MIKTAEFFIYTTLPVTMGKMDAISNSDSSAVKIPEACFGG